MTRQDVPGGVVHDLTADLREALTSATTALDAWRDITPLARNEFICWVEDAKQATTRARRIRRTREEPRKVSAGLLLARVQAPGAHRQAAGSLTALALGPVAETHVRRAAPRRGERQAA